ncbi:MULTISPECIES: hypothetical protein [unclassified Streptomyces]|uniref:hypothetical protein n=1 Tax=unclassified Streptomyces TaxID=2593676 RepID=UPI00332A6454
MAVKSCRPPTREQLAEGESAIDRVRGRRYCRIHPQQQMIPLLAGVDVCPACRGAEPQGPPGTGRARTPVKAGPRSVTS